MKIGTIIAVVLLLTIGGGMASYHFSDEQVAKRQLREVLTTISEAAMSQQTEQVLALFDKHLANDAS